MDELTKKYLTLFLLVISVSCNILLALNSFVVNDELRLSQSILDSRLLALSESDIDILYRDTLLIHRKPHDARLIDYVVITHTTNDFSYWYHTVTKYKVTHTIFKVGEELGSWSFYSYKIFANDSRIVIWSYEYKTVS